MQKHRGEFKLLQNNIFIQTSKTHCDDLFPVLYYLFPCSSMHTSSPLQPNRMKCKTFYFCRVKEALRLAAGFQADTVARGSSRKRWTRGSSCARRAEQSVEPLSQVAGNGMNSRAVVTAQRMLIDVNKFWNKCLSE